MNKMIRKLVAAIMALVLTVVMAVTVSYAWMTLSDAPVAEGIQITVGGGNTILVAANKTEEVNGVVYNYPDVFGSTLNFRQYGQYAYLGDVASLSPVSTSDGVHWFIPEYYDLLDKEVLDGEASVGQLKPVDKFTLDTDLAYANLSLDSKDDLKKAEKGSYVYLDFWVVSPGSDYQLRVSQGDGKNGSFLVELLDPTEGEDGKYTLTQTSGAAAASARVGFLVNEDMLLDGSLERYAGTYAYSEEYTVLRGSYAEKGNGMWYSSNYRFTIYEPNGYSHPSGENESYVITRPVSWDGERAIESDVSDRLTVQLSSRWKNVGETSGISVYEGFAAWSFGKDLSGKTDGEICKGFYGDRLQGQFAPYMNIGSFIKSTADLYAENGSETTAGATDDVYITTLEKNIPQRIRMFIWIEGQDVDCAVLEGSVGLALNIELAGSNKQ